MKQIPFKVLGQTWKIVLCKKSKYFNTKKDVGGTVYQTNTIYLKTHIGKNLIPASSMQSTLIHEIGHIVEYSLKIKIKHDDVDRFEAGFFDVLNDNGWLKLTF
jgi:predicted metal-dependent peptidase